MFIRNTQGRPYVFTQTDGETFRILSYETKPLADELISEEIRQAESLGWLRFMPEDVKEVKKTLRARTQVEIVPDK